MSEVSATVFGTFSKIGAKTSHVGSARIDYEIYKFLCEDNEQNIADPATKQKFNFDLIEDIKVKVCKVLSKEQSDAFLTETNLEKMKMSKQEIKNLYKRTDPKNPSVLISYRTRVCAFELYFDPSVENNLVYSILDSLLEVRRSNFSLTFTRDFTSFKTSFL